MLSKRDENKSMSDVTYCREAIREAFPKSRYGSVFSAQVEAFNFLRRQVEKEMTLRRVRAIWEGKARRIDGEEKDALRRAKIEEARREQQELRQRLSQLEQTLAALDARQAGFVGEDTGA